MNSLLGTRSQLVIPLGTFTGHYTDKISSQMRFSMENQVAVAMNVLFQALVLEYFTWDSLIALMIGMHFSIGERGLTVTSSIVKISRSSLKFFISFLYVPKTLKKDLLIPLFSRFCVYKY